MQALAKIKEICFGKDERMIKAVHVVHSPA